MKMRRFQVITTVEVPDRYEGDPDMKHAAPARAVAAAARVLASNPNPRIRRGVEVKEVT